MRYQMRAVPKDLHRVVSDHHPQPITHRQCQRRHAPALLSTVFTTAIRQSAPATHYDVACQIKPRGAAPLAEPIAFDLVRGYTGLVKLGDPFDIEVKDWIRVIGSPRGPSGNESYLAPKNMSLIPYTVQYLDEVVKVVRGIDRAQVDAMVRILAELRQSGGRLFVLGVGGGAGNAGHAVNDFRKICGIEAYAPTDNASELTARTNDDGWESVFAAWLRVSRLRAQDVVFVFSVGGGNLERNISANIVTALRLAKEVGAKVVGVVGRDGGYTKQMADACVVIPTVNPETVTPHTEAFQAIIWHLIVTHPALKVNEMKWESVR